MGQPVPHMPRPSAFLSRNEARRLSVRHDSAEPCCTQCGGPNETHASACQWCLSPKASASEPDMYAKNRELVMGKYWEYVMALTAKPIDHPSRSWK